jgi:hypothetical protein
MIVKTRRREPAGSGTPLSDAQVLCRFLAAVRYDFIANLLPLVEVESPAFSTAEI